LFIRQGFHLPLRKTEGFMESLTRLMTPAIGIPDYSSIPKRSISFAPARLEPGSATP
jgi:hypothetical protein